MIKSQDRSRWFGASDVAYIMGDWSTKSFAQWWLEKIGVSSKDFKTLAMMAGTHYEHKILDALGIRRRDRQIRMRALRLRVNLDGEDKNTVTEVKTYRKDFKVTKAYWQQCQVQMFASRKKCRIAAYRVTEEEYHNYFIPIDRGRITVHPIEYDPQWIDAEYLPRLKYLAKCLKKGVYPCESEYLNQPSESKLLDGLKQLLCSLLPVKNTASK